MEEKKSTNINSSTVIFLIIIIVLLGGIAYFVFQNKDLKNKQYKSEAEIQILQQKTQELQSLQKRNEELQKTIDEVKNITSKTAQNTSENSQQENEANASSESTLDQNRIIMEELKEKRFLAKNNIDVDSKVKYVAINNNENPLYIVHVEHESDDLGNRSTYFFVICENGQAVFSKALEHKYEYDLSYESNSMIIKAELEYKGCKRSIYGTVKDGEFEKLDEFIAPTDDETQRYIFNEKEISAKEFEKAKEKYSNKQFISFSKMAKQL